MVKPIGKEINELARDIRRFLSFHLDKYNLGEGQFGMLYDISKNEGISQDELSRKRNLDKTTIAKALKKLAKNGYVEKKRDESDKRVYRLHCTEKALVLMPEIKRVIALEHEILTMNLSEEEIQIFKRIMKRMTQNIEDYLNKMEE